MATSLLLTLAASLLLPALPGAGGAAHAAVLVSNLDQPVVGGGGGWRVWNERLMAQGFRTGGHVNGYNLSKIIIDIQDSPDDWSKVTVSLHRGDWGANNHVVTLVNSNGTDQFLLPSDTSVVLTRNTDYYLRIKHDSSNNNDFWLHATHDTDEDEDSADGWSIQNRALASPDGGINFGEAEGEMVPIQVEGTEVPLETDPKIKLIELSPKGFQQEFSRFIYSTYTQTFASTVPRVTLTSTPNQDSTRIDYLDGNDVVLPDADTGTDGHQVDLDFGQNTIHVRGTAQSGNTATYVLILTRETPSTRSPRTTPTTPTRRSARAAAPSARTRIRSRRPGTAC